MALVGLVSGGSSTRVKYLTKAVVEYVLNIPHYDYGAKIKRSCTKQHNLPNPARFASSWHVESQEHQSQSSHLSW